MALFQIHLPFAQQGASAGQVLKWNNVSWTPADDIGFDNWGTQVVQKILHWKEMAQRHHL